MSVDAIRSDAAWGWVYLVLHGHALDHLGILEPWADQLRVRQVDGDPFAADGEYVLTDPNGPIERFWAAEGAIVRQFDELVRAVPFDAWELPDVTPGWTLKDHVAHLAAWFDVAAEALDAHRAEGGWRPGPDGIDAWNARAAARDRGLSRTAALSDSRPGGGASKRPSGPSPRPTSAIRMAGAGPMRTCTATSGPHLAMIGPWCARIGWPRAGAG